ADDATLLQALARHPALLQRAIVVYRNRAVIGRPTERVHELLQG
ncbi:MAG: ArsC/Spx/MgsR family protein, partial [Burkholderiaceae bacterium]